MVQEILDELDVNWDVPASDRHEYHMEQLEKSINSTFTSDQHNLLAMLFSEC